MSHLTLFVPGLFSDLLPSGSSEQVGRWPALEKLIARADIEIPAGVSIETALCAEFGLAVSDTSTPPVADVTAAVDLVSTDGRRGFARVDPVYFRADQTGLVLFDARSLGLSAQEADTLMAHLNAGLAEHELTLLRGKDHTRWYAAVDCGGDFSSFSPRSVSGCHADQHMPTGTAAPFLRRVMNDAQMLLHGSEINSERQARGLPPVNSVWFWGAGRLPEPCRGRPDLVVGDDVLGAGLANQYGCVWLERTDDIPGLCDEIKPGQWALVVFGAPTGATAEPRQTTLDELEAQWCGPLLEALRRGRLRKLCMITDRARFVITRRSVRRFWRGATPLHVVKAGLAGQADA